VTASNPIICPECDRDIRFSQSCDQTLTYPYGREPARPVPAVDACGDCGCPPGGYHHRYCDQAYCLLDDRQLLMCDHLPGMDLK
jgi:hypothetical protein